MKKSILLALISFFLLSPALAQKRISMYLLTEDTQPTQQDTLENKSLPGKPIGTITAKETKNGLMLIPDLHDLPPGPHGFHVHAMSSCENHGMAAGGHLDPNNTKRHLGPYDDNGHLGDLPVIYVDKNGNANIPVLAPKLELSDIQGHALMIHAGGDNYSDEPEPLGGGGARLACGVASFILCE